MHHALPTLSLSDTHPACCCAAPLHTHTGPFSKSILSKFAEATQSHELLSYRGSRQWWQWEEHAATRVEVEVEGPDRLRRCLAPASASSSRRWWWQRRRSPKALPLLEQVAVRRPRGKESGSQAAAAARSWVEATYQAQARPGTGTGARGAAEAATASSAAAASRGSGGTVPPSSSSDTTLGSHPGITCDRSGMSPIVGIRYHLRGEDYDLCQSEYDKLSEDEKGGYDAIPPPPPKPKGADKYVFNKEGGGSGGGVERSLILFEEVEVTDEEDVGFYLALRKLAATSKCPIVLTCNTIPEGLHEASLPFGAVTFQRPKPSELLHLGRSVCKQRGLTLTVSEMEQVIQLVGCDMRRLIHTLQAWPRGGGEGGGWWWGR